MKILKNLTLPSLKHIGNIIVSNITRGSVYAKTVKTSIISEVTKGNGVNIFSGKFKDKIITGITIPWTNITSTPAWYDDTIWVHGDRYETKNSTDNRIIKVADNAVNTFIQGVTTFTTLPSIPTGTPPGQGYPTSYEYVQQRLTSYVTPPVYTALYNIPSSPGCRERWLLSSNRLNIYYCVTLPSLVDILAGDYPTILMLPIPGDYHMRIDFGHCHCIGGPFSTGHLLLTVRDGEVCFTRRSDNNSDHHYWQPSKPLKNYKDYAFFMGGSTSTSNTVGVNTVYSVSVVSGTTVNTCNSLGTARTMAVGSSGPMQGFVTGGYNSSAITNIEYTHTLSSFASFGSVGSLNDTRTCFITSVTGDSYAYLCGGYDNDNQISTDYVRYINLTTTSGGDVRISTLPALRHGAAGISGPQYGFICGGFVNYAYNSQITYFNLTTLCINTSNTGQLTLATCYACGLTGPYYGYICGGISSSGVIGSVEYIDITTHSVGGLFVGTLSTPRVQAAGASGSGYGLIEGGYDGYNLLARLDYIDITVTTMSVSPYTVPQSILSSSSASSF